MVSSEATTAAPADQQKKEEAAGAAAAVGANSSGEDGELMDFAFSSSLMLEGHNAASVKVKYDG